jgi:hypothetical protein
LTGPSADDLVAALQAQRNSDVSEPLEITVDGHPGVRVEISVPEGLDPASCTDGIVRIWEETVGYTSLSESETAPMSIVQTDLGRIVFSTSHGPEASEEDLAELDAIVASMVIND